ncbi:flavin reductase family protein [Amycolatopsis sp. lyj-109]|uniref:flavin reductase family protein n=1 Tax=Amycolatopsis sp. lyj-109 TaxID=2789287 RepID=UPI00397B1996
MSEPAGVDVRRLMAGFPTGVSVVTALASDGTPRGMTCTSLCSVALDPPTLLVCLRRGSPTLDAVVDTAVLSVNLLHRSARPAAELFGSGVPDRFDRIPWTAAPGGGPHLSDAAHTIADCVVDAWHPVGDHVVVMAEVARITSLRTPAPLLYGMRRYGTWAEDDDAAFLSYDFIS